MRNVTSQKGVNLIFLAVFIPLIGHIARYTPSSSEENISKNTRLKSYQVIFHRHLSSISATLFMLFHQFMIDARTISSTNHELQL